MKAEAGLIAWFARNPVAANLLMLMIILSGLFSLTEIRRQVFPEIEINIISIQVPYPGAAPQEVEEGINLKLEQAIENIDGIKQITSVAGEGFATVSIEVEDDYDVLQVLDEVKIQTDAIASFPEDAEKPIIYRVKPTHNVIWLALYGELSEFEMKTLANEIRDELVLLDGISEAKVVGERDYEIAIEEQVIPQLLQQFSGVKYSLEGASKEERSALKSLQQAFAIALVVIFALMAIPLHSYLQPLIVMFVIPFGFIGAIIGHWLLGIPISVLSLCGIIALAGVVVNGSLIMVDFVNRARTAGDGLLEAAMNAGSQRFRAIVLTSLTTFFGLTPIVLEKSLQAQIVIPMAVSLAFGILFATVMTLFMVPCLYLILDDLRKLASKLAVGIGYLLSR